MKKEIVYLTTWDNEIIEIETDFETWLKTKISTKNKGEDGIYLKSHKRYLKFSNIKDEKGKTLHLALEQPKEVFKERTQEEKIEFEKFKKEVMKKTFEGRKKRFHKERQEILDKLAKREEYFGLETTKSKLDNYNLIKVQGKK